MGEVEIKPGDIVEIEGERKTVAIADRSYPGDIGLNIIRMDGIIRKNAKTGIGEIAKVRKAIVKEAKKIIIAPARKGIVIRASAEIFKQGLLGRAVVKGDIVSLGGAKRRKSTMMGNPFFDEDILSILDESMMGIGFGDIKFVVVDTNPKAAVIILDSTEIEFRSEAVEIEEERVPDITYEDVGGLEDEIKKVREMVELPLKHPEIFERLGIEAPKGVLLHGPPGTGKTLLAKAVANETNSHFILINGPEIMSKYYGQSEENLRKKFEEAEKNAPSIIFIDEIDAIASKREETRGEVERRVVAQLLALMDGLQSRGKVVVIAASNVPNILDPALRRPGRFDREIEIGVPSKEGRLNILKIHTRNMPMYTRENLVKESDFEPEYKEAILNLIRYKDSNNRSLEKTINKYLVENPEKNDLFKKIEISKLKKYLDKINYDAKIVHLKELAEITHGFVGADLASLAKEAAMIVLRKVLPDIKLKEDEPLPKELLEKLVITQTDFKDSLKVVRPSALREVLVEIPNVKWSDIGGLENIKDEIKESVEWPLKHPEAFKRLGVRPPRGILLYGAPGSGKTLLAKAVANESEANFISVKGPEMLSKWVGESLPYDEELMVKKDGLIKRMKIGDIVENKEDVEVLAFDNEKRVIFSRIDYHIKHKLTSNLLEVTTRTGRKIKVTQDHSLFSFINGKLESVPTSYLVPGESFIATPKRLNLPRERIDNFNLYDYFRKDNSIFVGNVKDYLIRAKKILGSVETAQIIGISRKYLDDIISKNLPVLITKFDDIIAKAKLAIDFREICIKLKGSIHSYPSLFAIDKDFWRLVGLWVAEGDLNGYMVRIHNSNAEIREDAERICRKYNFFSSKSESCFSINSLFLQKLFRNILGLLPGAKNKKIPDIVYILDKESKANFLRGYFSGDGSIYPAERGKFKIEAGTVSEHLANDLLYLLLDFGIVASVYKKKERTGSITNRISVLGVKNFEKFNDIGFIDAARNNRIKEYIESRNWFRSEVIPLSGDLYRLASENITVSKAIGKERLKQVLILVDKDKTKYKEYWDLVEGDIFFDLVKEIKLIDNEEYVYDVSVPDGQNFVAGFGGIFAHNSEKAVREIFKKARQVSPCIIFFDEFDSLAPKRGASSDSHVSERVVNQLLTEIDGLEDLHDVVVIAATNRPDIVDTALLRPGRFDRMILTPIPEEKSRFEIFKVHTKGMPISVEVPAEKLKGRKMIAAKTKEGISVEYEEDKPIFNYSSIKSKDDLLMQLAKKTEGYVGADIEAVCREAAILALREDISSRDILPRHFEKALDKVRPSVTKEVEKYYEELREQLSAARAKQMLDEKPGYMG